MTQDDWLTRYRQRLMDRADLTAEQAQECAAADAFANLSHGFEDDPEGAADEELSLWSDCL